MIIRIPHLVRNFDEKSKAIVTLASGYSISSLATNLMYLFLPIMLTLQLNEQWAGAILSIGTVITFI
ncbi:MAG: hypothetical protein H6765_09095 [Candidatus Peribacteria bacterium]|nr:MAG: hypothetical protein H6765_09095 [Candidatus Peribacteria bacterium]